MPPSAVEALCDSHEERIGELDQAVKQGAAERAEQRAYQKVLFKQMEELKLEVRGSHKETKDFLGQKLDGIASTLQGHNTIIQAHETRVARIEEREQRQQTRRDWWLKVGASVVASGIVGAGAWLVAHFS